MSFTPALAEPTDVCSAHFGPPTQFFHAAFASRIADIRSSCKIRVFWVTNGFEQRSTAPARNSEESSYESACQS